jgi:hypothetical protein
LFFSDRSPSQIILQNNYVIYKRAIFPAANCHTRYHMSRTEPQLKLKMYAAAAAAAATLTLLFPVSDLF